MKILEIKHKGLKQFILKGTNQGISPEYAEKLGDMIDFLLAIQHSDEIKALAYWKPETLSDGRISLHISANYRLTFKINDAEQPITELNYEDYH